VIPPIQKAVADEPSLVLPTYSQMEELPVVYTNDPKVVSRWLCDNIPSTQGCVLGFDVESVGQSPWMKRKNLGPATVQLATPGSCLVVQLVRHNGKQSVASAPTLEAVLSDDTIIKAGVSIDDDMRQLYRHWGGLEAWSRFDLGGLGGSPNGKNTSSIKRLAKGILGLDVGKRRSVTNRNWGKVPLESKQLMYCARDAWLGAAIVDALASKDPETFSPEALHSLLLRNSERSIEQTHERLQRRKVIKSQLRTLLQDQPSGCSKYPDPNHRLPPSIQSTVTELQKELRELVPAKAPVFDVKPLGFTIPPPSSDILQKNHTHT